MPLYTINTNLIMTNILGISPSSRCQVSEFCFEVAYSSLFHLFTIKVYNGQEIKEKKSLLKSKGYKLISIQYLLCALYLCILSVIANLNGGK